MRPMPRSGVCRSRPPPVLSALAPASSSASKSSRGNFDSVAVYDVQAHTQSWIRGAIRGEKRLTADRHPVVWDLVLRSPDRYAWHRTDWVLGGYTAEIARCPDVAAKRP